MAVKFPKRIVEKYVTRPRAGYYVISNTESIANVDARTFLTSNEIASDVDYLAAYLSASGTEYLGRTLDEDAVDFVSAYEVGKDEEYPVTDLADHERFDNEHDYHNTYVSTRGPQTLNR